MDNGLQLRFVEGSNQDMWNQMFYQNLIEFLKLLASITTPIAIAFIGLRINSTIQRQNAIAQRRSSWLEKWADDFLKTSSAFNDSATNFIMLYVSIQWKTTNNLPGVVDEQKLFHLNVIPLALALNRGQWEMSKYAGFARVSGKSLEEAAKALFDEANNWISNKGGNINEFLDKQLTFNINARKVHAELLGLKDSK
jgi:hypothetical protein